MKITVFEYMEDFDNEELNDYDRFEQLYEAVLDFNEEFDTTHDPRKTVERYFQWNKAKYSQE